MKIVGMMVVGPGEADRYLENSLKELARLCDDAVIALNNADEKTVAMVKSYGFWYYTNEQEWGKHQPDIKTDLLKRVGRLLPDWVIAIDSDEIFPPEFTRKEAERLAMGKEVAYHFFVVNLYNDPEHFAHSAGIQRFWNIRFFKYLPQYGLEYQHKALHCGLAPPIMYQYGGYAPYYLEHYGLMKKEDREKKVQRYKKYDPNHKFKNGVYYEELAQELKAHVFDRRGLLNQLASLPETRRIPPKLP